MLFVIFGFLILVNCWFLGIVVWFEFVCLNKQLVVLMIFYIVFCYFNDGYDFVELWDVMVGLGELQVEGFLWFKYGINVDVEGKML